MKDVANILKLLSNGNKQHFNEVALEIKELLVDENDGVWKVKTDNALRLAFELERSYVPEQLPSQMETHTLLLKTSTDKDLINKIFARKGVIH